MLKLIKQSISKLVETKNNSKYLIGYLDEALRPLVLLFPDMSGYVTTFKSKCRKNNNKLMSLPINGNKLLTKCKTIWTEIEDFKNIKLDALPAFDDRYLKTKIRAHGDKVYTDFRGLNVSKDGLECESFTVIPIHSLVISHIETSSLMYTAN